VTLGTANGLSLSGQQLSLSLASSGTTGAISSTDWNTFNNKINLTSLSATGGIVYNSGTGLFSWNGTTDKVAEGITNLYYTTARFLADFTAQFQAAFDTAFGWKTTDQLAEWTTNLYFTDTRAQNAMSGTIAGINANISTLSGNLATTTANLTSLTNTVNTLSGNLNSLSGTVASNFSTLSGSIVSLTNTVNTISGSLNTLTNTVNTLSGTVTSNFNTLSGSISTTNSNLATTNTNLSTVSGALASLTTTVNTLSGSLNSLSGTVASLTTTVTNNYNTLSGSINTTNNNLSAISGSLNTLTNTVTTLSGTVTTISNTVNTMSGQIAALQAATHAAVTLGTANGLSLSGQQLSLSLASSGTTGAISSTDWTTFNNKINLTSLSTTGSYLSYNNTTGVFGFTGTTTNFTEGTNLYYTQARFDAALAAKTTTNVAEGTNLYFTNARAIVAPLTGFVAGSGTVTATDSILQAFQKLQGSNTIQDTNISTLSGTLATKIGLNSLSALGPVTYNNSTGVFGISTANSTTTGALSAIDWNTFNNKQSAMVQATTSASGWLSSIDWNVFNNKQSIISLASPANGLTFASNILGLGLASTTTTGALSMADWNTFNNKIGLTALSVTGGLLTYNSGTGLFGTNLAAFSDNGLSLGVDGKIELWWLLHQTTTIALSGNNFNFTGLGNVGIGTATPGNKLEITSSGSGLSGLRFTNLFSGSILTPYNGLQLSLNWSGDVIMTQDALSANKAWGTLGNAGLSAATNFMGTTDAIDVAFRTNNTEWMRLTTAGVLALRTTTPNTTPGFNSNALEFWDSDGAHSDFTQRVAWGGYGTYNIIAQNGTLAAPTAVTNNQYLGEYVFGGYNGSAFSKAANVYAQADGIPSATSMPGRMVWGTTAVGWLTPIERMRLDSAGNLGIGTISPKNRLEVTSTGAGLSGLRFTNLTSLSATGAYNGKQLSVNGSGDVIMTDDATSANKAWGTTGNTGLSAVTNFIGTTDAVDFVTRTNNTERMRILANGNVGIGTTNPNGPLQIVRNAIGTNNAITSWASDLRWAGFMPILGAGSYNPISAPGDSGYIFSNDGSSAAATGGFVIAPWSNTSGGIKIMENGNVGIGAATPGNSLEITSAGAGLSGLRFTNLTSFSATGAYNGKQLSVNSLGDVIMTDDATSANKAWGTTGNTGLSALTNFIGTTDAVDFVTRTNNTERMRILANGNVGIGTNTAYARLSFGASHNTGLNQYTDPTYGIRNDILSIYEVANSKYGLGIHGGTLDMYAPDGNGMMFGHRSAAGNLTSRMYMGGTGNIGIGNTNPAFSLDVTGTTRANLFTFQNPTGDPAPIITARAVPVGQGDAPEKTEMILFHSNDANNCCGDDQITLRAPALSFQTYTDTSVSDINNNAGYNERMRILPNGNVGIGTTAPSDKLQVAGGVTATAFTTASDSRFKQGVTDIGSDALTRLASVRPVTYTWNALGQANGGRANDIQYGMIAQEVESLFPDLVETRQDGYKGINYQGFVPVLIKAVTSLDANKASTGSVNALSGSLASQSLALSQMQSVVNSLSANSGTIAPVAGTTVINNYTIASTGSVDTGSLAPVVNNYYTSSGITLQMTGTGSPATQALTVVQADVPRSALAYITDQIAHLFDIVSDFVALQITAVRGYFDEVFARTTHTETLCIGTVGNETCITKSELDALIAGVASTPPAPVTPIVPATTLPPAPTTSVSTGSTSSGSTPPTPVAPDPVRGCMDTNATNYMVTATEDDGSCTAPVVTSPIVADPPAILPTPTGTGA
jgi:archaellum component FlaC